MSIGFNYPEFLLLLLLLPLFIFMARGRNVTARIRRFNRRISIFFRLLILALLIFTVADAQLKITSDKLVTVFLLDSSDSVGNGGKTQGLAFTRAALARMNENQQGGVIVFGQEALVEKLVSSDKRLDKLESNPTSTYSNLAEAVRIGTALLPGDAQRRLVLVSDGNENVDDVRSAAKIAAANGVQIDVVPVTQQEGPEVSLNNITVPSNLRQGEQFTLNVSVESNFAGNARLLILQDGQVVSDSQVDLQKGINQFKQALKASSKGFVNYTARIVPGKDTLEQNNQANAYSLVKGKPRSLLVEGHPADKEASNLSSALNAAEIETSIIPPEKFPGLTELTQYDSVVLVNVPASNLTSSSMNILQAYVRDLGKGLVVVGGEESYGLGGYFRTPLEDMLPVELQLPSKLQTPSVAMVLVIDRSGSMAESYNGPGAGAAGIAKIELAKDAAYLAATQLSNSDQVGIITFDTQAQWQVPLAAMGNPANLVSPIGRIAPGGGTNIYSGLAPAVEALKNAKAANKHIILLTDGQDSEGISYEQAFADARAANITISTVGLGEDVNETFLKNMANRNAGRYYFVNDPSNLPKIFARESHMAARSYIIEEPFTPAIANPSPILKGITAMPPLKGYVGTRAKATSTLALVTGRNEPLLAHWQYGLGRVAAWTSDAKGRWATNWLTWNDFPRFWSQVVRWTIAENEAGGLQVQTKVAGNRILIEADALGTDSQYLNNLEARALVVSSTLSGNKEEVTLKQTAPGHYEGYFVPRETGSFIVNVEAGGQLSNSDKPVNLTQTIGAVSSYSPEYKQLGTNTALLEEVANLTGGVKLTNPEDAFKNDLARTTRNQDLWPWLLALAILLFPLDVGVRRVNFSIGALKRGFKENRLEKNLALATAREVPPTSSEVSRLFAAKERVRTERGLAPWPEQGTSSETNHPVPRKLAGMKAEGGGFFNGETPGNSKAFPASAPLRAVSEVVPGRKIEPGGVTPAVIAQDKIKNAAPSEPEESNITRLNTIIHRSKRTAPGESNPGPGPARFSDRGLSQPRGPAARASVVSIPDPETRPKPGEDPAKKPPKEVKEKEKPAAVAEAEEGNMTSRLLRAKQRANEERKK